MNVEAGDLIENLDIDNLDHAEKFLIATESRVGPYGPNGLREIELLCVFWLKGASRRTELTTETWYRPTQICVKRST